MIQSWLHRFDCVKVLLQDSIQCHKSKMGCGLVLKLCQRNKQSRKRPQIQQRTSTVLPNPIQSTSNNPLLLINETYSLQTSFLNVFPSSFLGSILKAYTTSYHPKSSFLPIRQLFSSLLLQQRQLQTDVVIT